MKSRYYKVLQERLPHVAIFYDVVQAPCNSKGKLTTANHANALENHRRLSESMGFETRIVFRDYGTQI